MDTTRVPKKEHPERPKVVIIGGGFGGLYAAKALSGEAVDVTLIDRKNHHTFQPLLYQVALSVLWWCYTWTPLVAKPSPCVGEQDRIAAIPAACRCHAILR
jgi:choline dehydrogenase-like flavoprotein